MKFRIYVVARRKDFEKRAPIRILFLQTEVEHFFSHLMVGGAIAGIDYNSFIFYTSRKIA